MRSEKCGYLNVKIINIATLKNSLENLPTLHKVGILVPASMILECEAPKHLLIFLGKPNVFGDIFRSDE